MEEKDYKEFASLVKKMREAQMECAVMEQMVRIRKKEDISEELMAQFAAVTCNVIFYEDKVDEYLKKMESIDQRKALEAENTEFEYGHNVKHYNED